jgi:two-component system nitrogen regulation response regulator NtrX
VRVNCGATPPLLIDSELFGHERGSFTGAVGTRKGWFERADGGTLFLDEIAELPLEAQVRLLRVLQDGSLERVGGHQAITVDVRIVAATHRNLETMVAEGRFREDLWYRISIFPIRLPALRERPQDIRPLAEYFLEDFCARNNFKPKTLDVTILPMLESYGWPGNARELRNVIERMAILTPGERLTRDSIPVEVRVQREAGPKSTIQEARESAEREHILRALDESNWNVSGAARALGMERTNLHKRIRALGLTRGK